MPYKYATQNCEHCEYCVKTDKGLYCSHREGHPRVTGGSWCIDMQEKVDKMNNDMIPVGTTIHIDPKDIKWECNGGDLISRSALKKSIKSYADDQYAENEYLGEYAIMDIIDNAPATEEIEKPFITECRNASIEQNLPLYFIYYEESGILEVYVTETKELFEKRHCSKHLPNYKFREAVMSYLDWYSDWKRGAE